MSSEQIKEVLIAALEHATQKPVDRAALRDEVDLREGLGVDSLSLIEAVWEIEEKLDIHIDEEALKKLNTVGDVLGTVGSLLDAKQVANA